MSAPAKEPWEVWADEQLAKKPAVPCAVYGCARSVASVSVGCDSCAARWCAWHLHERDAHAKKCATKGDR